MPHAQEAPKSTAEPRSHPGKTDSQGPNQSRSHQTGKTAVGNSSRTASPPREHPATLQKPTIDDSPYWKSAIKVENTLHLGVVKLVVHIKRDHSIVMVAINGTVRPTTLLSQKREKLSTTRRSSDQTIQRVHPCTMVVRKSKGSTKKGLEPPYSIVWGKMDCRKI